MSCKTDLMQLQLKHMNRLRQAYEVILSLQQSYKGPDYYDYNQRIQGDNKAKKKIKTEEKLVAKILDMVQPQKFINPYKNFKIGHEYLVNADCLIEDNLDTVYESINIFKTIDYVQINKFGDMHLVLKDRHEACSPPWQYIIKRLQSQNDALLKQMADHLEIIIQTFDQQEQNQQKISQQQHEQVQLQHAESEPLQGSGSAPVRQEFNEQLAMKQRIDDMDKLFESNYDKCFFLLGFMESKEGVQFNSMHLNRNLIKLLKYDSQSLAIYIHQNQIPQFLGSLNYKLTFFPALKILRSLLEHKPVDFQQSGKIQCQKFLIDKNDETIPVKSQVSWIQPSKDSLTKIGPELFEFQVLDPSQNFYNISDPGPIQVEAEPAIKPEKVDESMQE